MARAKLHYAFAIDQEVHEASKVDPTLFDPILRLDGDLPALTKPFRVVRYYLGPQGMYTEHFALTDPEGRELVSSVVRRIELAGQMRETRFTSRFDEVRVSSPEEHVLTFFLDGEAAGSVPVFIETGLGPQAQMEAQPVAAGAPVGTGDAAAAGQVSQPQPAADPSPSGGEDSGEVHVEAQIDQEVYERLIAEGKSERIARSKAKAAYVRAEKERLSADREDSSA